MSAHSRLLMPEDEAGRLAAVRRYDILDTPPDGTFDRITALAADLFDVPIAIVSIVDEDRIWFKSHHGLDATEIPRSPGLCASAIMKPGLYILDDAQLDPVALTNPLVAGDFGLRFYAAAPLTTSDHHNLGTLCVIDKAPRTPDESQLRALTQLADLVVHELELRLAARTTVAWETELRQEALEGRLRVEELASALQAALLPPALPRIPGLRLAAHHHPVHPSQVGGDFYDVFPLPRRSWGITIGDVCGKGPRAAAITTAARYALRAAAMECERPSDVLAVLNRTLLPGQAETVADAMANDLPRLCTAVYARLRPATGGAFRVQVASGGHPLPRVVRASAGVERFGAYGTLIGAFESVSFADRSTRLFPGDLLVLVTDGVTESVVGGTPLGSSGLDAVLGECAGLSADETLERIVDRVTTGSASQRDDVAIVVAEVE